MLFARAALFTFLYTFSLRITPATAAPEDSEPVVIDDSDPRAVWTPVELRSCAEPGDCQGAWFLDTRTINARSTLHLTAGPGTALELKFQGSSIAVFGAKLPNGAPAVVTLDAGTPERISTQSDIPQFQAQLFATQNVDPAVEHTLRIAYDGNAQQLLGIDFFEIGTSTAQPPDQRFPPAAAAAIGFGGAVAALIVLVALFLFARRRFKAQRRTRSGHPDGRKMSWWDFTSSMTSGGGGPPASAAWRQWSQFTTLQEQGRSVPEPAHINTSMAAHAADSPVARWASDVQSLQTQTPTHTLQSTRTAPRLVSYHASPLRSHHTDRTWA
ncbi:hypothetical protein AURDEDRAFT_125997 [Auricularia subglabra TFB-10046 SS5]|nr:hypothetical protein AURDEDRAFT_125997 [Auricularia subglabra TFB-10046 SS5]